MLLTSSATNTPYYDHPRTVRLRSTPAFASRDPSQELGARGTNARATGARFALRQMGPPVGERLTAFAELRSLSSTVGGWGMPVRLHRGCGEAGAKRHLAAAFSAACEVTRATSDVFVAANVSTDAVRREPSSPGATRSCMRQHARTTPLQDAFHREEPKGQEV